MSDIISKKDLKVSATLQDIDNLDNILEYLKENGSFGRMLDLGCGYGGLSKYVGNFLGISSIYGIDKDIQRLDDAKKKGIRVYTLNLDEDKIPFPNNHFDIITSFGVLEHLVAFDNILAEIQRVLSKEGYFLLSMPNLGSWINRIALLLGYQPRDVEVSQIISPGVLTWYRGGGLFHLHSITMKALKCLLDYYGFQVVLTKSLSPYCKGRLFRMLDWIPSKFPSLSRRFMVIAKPQLSQRSTQISKK